MVLDRVIPIKYISDCSCQLFSLYFPALVCDKRSCQFIETKIRNRGPVFNMHLHRTK